jgi:hypothetical protein
VSRTSGTDGEDRRPTRRVATGAAMTLRLVRKEAGGDLPLLACLAVLVLVLTALCAWAPAVAGRQEDKALRQRITVAQTGAPLVSISATPEVFHDGAPPGIDMATLLSDGRTLTGGLGRSAARHLTLADSGSYDYNQGSVSSPDGPDSAVTSTKLALSHLPQAGSHLRYVSGHAPADRTPVGGTPQIALSQASAQAMGVRTGSRVGLDYKPVPGAQQPPPHVELLVSGVFRTVAGTDGFWTGQATLVAPSRYPEERSAGTVLAVRGLVGTDAANTLAGAGIPGPLVTWKLRAELPHAALDQARALTGPLAHYGADLNAERCQGLDPFTGDSRCQVGDQFTDQLVVSDALTPLLAAFTAQDHQARALASFAVDSLAAVALATTAVAVRLLLRRRRPHLGLQRARGASTARLVLLRGSVAWPVVLAAAVLGWVAGRLLAPDGTSGSPEPLPAAVAVLTVLLVVPLLTWFAVREPARRRHRPRRSRRRPALGGRRVVMELTVLLAAVAGVATLRSQGPDWELGAVPVVVALATVLLLLRIYPLVLRLVAWQTRRGRGVVGFVGVSRAAHDAPATGLALFVLVLTLGTAVFGGLVQRTIDDGLATGATWSTGADAGASVAGTTTPVPGSGTPGIRTAVQQLRTLDLMGQADGAELSTAAVVSVDPRQLTAIAPHSALARTLLAELTAPPRKAGDFSYRIPVLISPDLRARERTGAFTAVAPTPELGGAPTQLTLDPVGTLTTADTRDPLLGPVTAQLPAGTPLLITAAAAEQVMPPQSSGSTVLLLQGTGASPVKAVTLRAAAAQALGPLAHTRIRSEELSALRDDGLTKGLGTIYTAGSALAALLGLLAVALELVLTAHERGRTTSFLRTLGLGGAGAGAVNVLQLLPLAAASVVGGTLLGLLEPRLMSDTLNLRQFTGGPAQPVLRTDYALTVGLVVGVTLLIVAAATVETVLARRRRLGAVLRVM